MQKHLYIDLRAQTTSENIDTLFPNWERGNERLAVFGAHDDDPLIGAGYAMSAAAENDADLFVVIFCNGNCGYSTPEQKLSIVETRRVENENAMVKFGVPRENITRFEYPDFSLRQFAGKTLDSGKDGTFLKIVDFIRKKKITRVLIPNGFREHYDHTAAYEMAIYDIVQAGDPVVSDRGKTQKVKSTMQYSVWADFSPEDALVRNEKNCSIRANKAILCQHAVEDQVCDAISEYSSQAQIIENLMQARKERFTGNGFLELYIDMDPRPKLDYSPYVSLVKKLTSYI